MFEPHGSMFWVYWDVRWWEQSWKEAFWELQRISVCWLEYKDGELGGQGCCARIAEVKLVVESSFL